MGTLVEHCKSTTNAQGKEVLGLLFGFIAFTWKHDLIDPLDKQPSLSKALTRIMDALSGLFKENSKLVNKACGMAISELLDNCFQDKTDPVMMECIMNPLINMLSAGSDKAR